MRFALRSALRFALLLIVSLAGGCAGVQIGPFVPPNPKHCGSDVDCPAHQQCRFPGVDTRAICMPGPNEWPGEGPPQ